jgi:hypothetical protein
MAAALVTARAPSAAGQATPTPTAAPTPTPTPASVTAAGHWTGAIETPGEPLQIEVDLKPGAPPDWAGAISIPVQNLKGFALGSIDVTGTAVSFVIPGAPGAPTFRGTLSADGANIAGDFSQGGATLPFKLTRAGQAVMPPPPPRSTTIAKAFEGSWAGTLQAGDRSLRLLLKLVAGAEAATGTLTSVDQGGAEIPIGSITQTGTHLEVQLPSISGSYSGDLKDGKLVGTWSQGPGSLPLEFVRPTP